MKTMNVDTHQILIDIETLTLKQVTKKHHIALDTLYQIMYRAGRNKKPTTAKKISVELNRYPVTQDEIKHFLNSEGRKPWHILEGY
jgi:predicted transcriptional regulator